MLEPASANQRADERGQVGVGGGGGGGGERWVSAGLLQVDGVAGMTIMIMPHTQDNRIGRGSDMAARRHGNMVRLSVS